MPKFTVMLIETLTHRVVVEAPTETAAKRAAETFLTETDHNDDYLFRASGYEASHTVPAADDSQPDVVEELEMPTNPAQRHHRERAIGFTMSDADCRTPCISTTTGRKEPS